MIIAEMVENTDDKERLTNIFSALNQVAGEIPIVLPLHPRTRKMLIEYKLEQYLNTLIVIEPVGFLDMICLESNAKLIITDSGGVQKEVYFHKVPCVTLRDETEWVETVEAGWNVLTDVSKHNSIIPGIKDVTNFKGNRNDINEYGDGRASEKIIETVYHFLYCI